MKKVLVLFCLLTAVAGAAYFAGFNDVQKIKAFFVAEKTADSRVTSFAPSQPVSIGTEKRVALVVGNGDYLGDDNDLPNDINDANDIAEALRGYGFQIMGNKALTDVNLTDMLKALDDFELQLQQGGVGLFYYSGHGLEVDGQQYIVPVDANPQINSKSELPYRMIEINKILEKLGKNKTQLNLMILDSCRNNPFAVVDSGGKALGYSASGYKDLRDRKDIPTGILIASATATGKTASPAGIRNSVYTKHLLSYMNTEPNLEVGLLLRKVRTAVKQETNEKQIPWENGAIEGEFYFAPVHYNQSDNDIKIKAEAVRKLEEKAAQLRAETERQEALAKKAEELKLEAEKNKADDGWKTINRYQVKDDLVKDTKTSLMWMRCSLGQDWNGKTCKGKATEYTWDDAMKVPNNFRFMGYSDWRVPTIEELKTLVYCDNGEEQTWNMKISEWFNDCDIKNYKQPTIMSDVFPNTPSVFFWSSSPNANSGTKAIVGSGISVWATAFHSGNATLWDTNMPSAVRLVRGASFNVSQSKVKINHPLNVAKLEHNLPRPHKVVHHKIGKTKDSHNVYSMLH